MYQHVLSNNYIHTNKEILFSTFNDKYCISERAKICLKMGLASSHNQIAAQTKMPNLSDLSKNVFH